MKEECVFKQYRDDDLGLHSETMVYFSQCSPDQKMNLCELLKMTSDMAVEDFNRRCMSRETLADNGVAILVSRDSFRIHKYPVENQHIIVRTWEEKSEALQFVRMFQIEDMDGNKLITGVTAWLLVDVKARRIMPIKKFDDMGLRKPPLKVSERDCLPYGKISVPDDAVLLDERVIKFTDLDANGHTNNSRYAAFAIDALPQEYQKIHFKDFRINFVKEALLGQKVSIWASINDESKTILLCGKTEEGVSFEVELKW